ncbi:MAG: hypothetical protein GX638_17295 [Crenarchaeota archaeon]|nr:hypothetical protein [Thermoproteota archaeon]
MQNLTITGFQTDAIGLDFSTQIIILANNLTGNLNNGIRLYSSSHNLITGNNITDNKYMSGIQLIDNSTDNIISKNTLSENSLGLIIEKSTGNKIFHNNIADKYQQTWVSEGYANVWDDGYPSGGNYWKFYNGTDTNNDGIGDSPYIIDAFNQDNYPLIEPLNSTQLSYSLTLPPTPELTPSLFPSSSTTPTTLPSEYPTQPSISTPFPTTTVPELPSFILLILILTITIVASFGFIIKLKQNNWNHN